MEHVVVRTVIQRIRRVMPDVGFAVEFEHAVAHEPGFELLLPLVPQAETADDVLAILPGPRSDERGRIQKVLAYDLARDFDEFFDSVIDTIGDVAVASHSGLRFVELAAGRVTKATALSLLTADLAIDAADVVCFGDNNNDIPMLEWAGESFAMGNGTAEAKAAADETIGANDDDGLAAKIEELLDRRR